MNRLGRTLTLLLLAFVSLAGNTDPAYALDPACATQSTTRFALVIGSNYSGALTISGRIDAEAMAEALCNVGFAVREPLTEATFDNMTSALDAFRSQIRNAKDVVFYFSGHGFQVNLKNYLLPEDRTAVDPDDYQMPLSTVIRSLEGAPNEARKLIFLDACNTSAELRLINGNRLSESPQWRDGLGEPGQAASTAYFFAADIDQRAVSGKSGKLSPFTLALEESLREPGLELRELFGRVQKKVLDLTWQDQLPIDRGIGGTPHFYFRSPVRVQLKVSKANDDLIAFVNGANKLTASAEQSVPVDLKAGDNDLILMVSNGKAYASGQNWRLPDGWDYEAEIELGDGEKMCEGQPLPLRFSGREPVPYKNGPHHGKIFEVARVKLRVDPRDAKVCVTEVKDRIWEQDSPFHARRQEKLWSKSLAEMPLEENTSISNYLALLDTVKQLVEIFGLGSQIKFPDFSRIFGEVWGNGELRPMVEICMDDAHWKERLTDLERSLADTLSGKELKPFDSFDRSLSRCVQGLVRPDSGFPASDALVWTAFDQRSPTESTGSSAR